MVLELTTHAFVQNTVQANLNPLDLVLGGRLVEELLAAQWLPLLLAAVYLVARRPWLFRGERLIVLYWAAASLPLLGMTKVGANHNYWIEFAAATAILAAGAVAGLVRAINPRHASAAIASLMVIVGVAVGGPEAVLSAARAVRSDA